MDDDVVECSSDDSDIIEINDEIDSENNNSHSSSAFNPVDCSEKSPSKVMRLSNGNGMNGVHSHFHNGEVDRESELKMNGQVNKGGNQDENSNGKADDSITLID